MGVFCDDILETRRVKVARSLKTRAPSTCTFPANKKKAVSAQRQDFAQQCRSLLAANIQELTDFICGCQSLARRVNIG